MLKKKTKPVEKPVNMTQNEALAKMAMIMEKQAKCNCIWHWVMGVLVFLIAVFFYFGNIITYYLNSWLYQVINK